MREAYNTKQRECIIEYLKDNSNKFVKAEDIENYIKKCNLNISQATIYRTLKKLEDDEVVIVEVKNLTKYYQYANKSCENHYHLKCSKCGKLIHFECEDFNKIIKHIADEHKFSIDAKSIIYGICNECKNK